MIRVENLWKKYGRFDALRGLSFDVPDGSAFALIGANGAGKTTTIKVLMNIFEPTRGSATLLGVDSRKVSPRELAQIGYVSENQDMPARLTVGEYVAYLRPFYSTRDRDLEASIALQLRLPLERKIGDLSHGMRMKMALMCALPYRPKLLILDEPFSGLDPLVRDEFMEGLLEQAGEMTILISSHELGEIDGVATNVAFLDEGKLMFQESMSDLTGRFREVRVTLETEAAPPRQAPKEWMQIRTIGNVLTFVDTRFNENGLGERVRSRMAGVRGLVIAFGLLLLTSQFLPWKSAFGIEQRLSPKKRDARDVGGSGSDALVFRKHVSDCGDRARRGDSRSAAGLVCAADSTRKFAAREVPLCGPHGGGADLRCESVSRTCKRVFIAIESPLRDVVRHFSSFFSDPASLRFCLSDPEYDGSIHSRVRMYIHHRGVFDTR